MRLPVPVTLLALVSCATPKASPQDDRAVRAVLLRAMLNAPNDRAFGEALLNHGPVEDPDLPAILEASKSGSAAKRRNAARALPIMRGDKAPEAQLRFINETHDVDSWAVILGGFRILDRHPDWAGRRPDLIRIALASGNAETAATGIRAGVFANYPGIDREIDRRLDHKDFRVRSACLVSLDPRDGCSPPASPKTNDRRIVDRSSPSGSGGS